ncbi:hypothetical protein GCM10007938_02840 [Vibrio zhanjiangensis]|uniref:Uncharacterized protein n=1 Tax=Vibrio zhanjiangensis TaxID=1046128 RepID=A0ABQ6ETN9_9VIBR|nr:hypothetical protein [Vibrio zhanjiangensis]GLT16508.1 hypothetical protein GCM10007938_02840 [Vibrio zhanjiangensis]
MRERITPNQLSHALTQKELDQSIGLLDSSILELEQLKPSWLKFCREKSQLASESWSFLFRQWVGLHRNGYPATTQDYLQLVERDMLKLKQVYVALFHFHPGLVYELKERTPELFIWLMLEPEFCHDPIHVNGAFSVVQNVDQDIAMLMFLRTKAGNIDTFVAQCIEGKVAIKKWCFELLKLRHSLSISLIKHWLKNKVLDETSLHSTLAKFDVAESIEWLGDQDKDEDHLFELLLCKHDRGTWFRRRFGTDQSTLSGDKLVTYAKLLELREFNRFEQANKMAPMQLFLSADPAWVEATFEYLTHLDDEAEGERWLFSLYLIYGDRFPLKPNQLDIEYDWDEAKKTIKSWCESKKHQTDKPLRLGEALSYQSTLDAMRHPWLPNVYREWLWRQLCMHGRVYIPWHWTMPSYQQDWVFEKVQHQIAASERFNLRNQNATVGY